MYDFEQLCLKNAIKDSKVIFDDDLVKIASDPKANINEAIFEVEFSNFLNGNAHQIYLNPALFFRKTHFTEYMKNVLKRALSRVTSISDESYAVVLDTTFGGGKTHTLISLYHLFENRDVALNSRTIKQIMKDLELGTIPDVKLVTVDGHNIEPETNLWNVIGEKLGNEKLATRKYPPTAQEIEDVIKDIGRPVVFLFDELVNYISKIMGEEDEESYDGKIAQNKAFIHSLFVATEATKTSLVVLTIPRSEAYKKEADILRSISAIAERGATKIAPVAKEDIIRILKKRFVKEIVDEKFAKSAAKALHDLQASKVGISDAYSEERLFECYPFHPLPVEEIFFGRIGTYEDFQITRGILKIMARVIVNLLRHVDELPKTTLFISSGEVDLSEPEMCRKLTTSEIFGKNLDQVVQTDIATTEGSANAQKFDNAPRFGNFARIATTVYLYSLFPDESRWGANSKKIFNALGDSNFDPSTIDTYLEKLYDEVSIHIFRAEGTDRYFFKTEENPRALVRLASRDVRDQEVKIHLQKQFFSNIIPSTDSVSVNIFDNEIKRDNTEIGKLNLFAVDYEDVYNHYMSLKRTKEYESEADDVLRTEVFSKIFSQMLSITTPNRNSVVLLFPIPTEINPFKDLVKELIACEKLKKERSKDKDFLKELKSIQERIYAKAAQKLINTYSYTGFYYRNDQTLKQISPISYDKKAKYTERIFYELESKWGKVISNASIDYINGILGRENDYVKFSDLVHTVANSTSYPFIPAKPLKESIKEQVSAGEIGLLSGEIIEPDEVDLKKSDEVLKRVKFGSEVSELKDSSYVLKKEFAEQLFEAARKKKADRIAEYVIEALGDSNYAEVSEVESHFPEYSRSDVVEASKIAARLEVYGGDISLIEKIENGEEPDFPEAQSIRNAFGKEGNRTYILKKEFYNEVISKLKEVTPEGKTKEWPKGYGGEVETKEESIPVHDLVEKFDDYANRTVVDISVTGTGSGVLKDDSMNISGAVSFLSLDGNINVSTKGITTFYCNVSLEKAGTINEIMQKIASLDENPEYSININLTRPVEINEDFKLFVDQLAQTESEKILKVS